MDSDLCCLLQSSHRFDDQPEKEDEREIRRTLEIKILEFKYFIALKFHVAVCVIIF